MDDFKNFCISFAASLVAILVVLYIERLRRPNLRVRVLPALKFPHDPSEPNLCTWFQVGIDNIPRAPWLSWFYTRDPAVSCRAYVSFYAADGAPLFQGEMLARWSSTSEPHVERISDGEKVKLYLRDVIPTIDIHAHETEPIHPIIVFAQPLIVHGWSNQSYLSGWKDPKWLITEELFIMRLRVTTAGQEVIACFRVDLSGGYEKMCFFHLDSELCVHYTPAPERKAAV